MNKDLKTVGIQFNKNDYEKLTAKAKEKRLKLSSYLRYELMKNFKNE